MEHFWDIFSTELSVMEPRSWGVEYSSLSFCLFRVLRVPALPLVIAVCMWKWLVPIMTALQLPWQNVYQKAVSYNMAVTSLSLCVVFKAHILWNQEAELGSCTGLRPHSVVTMLQWECVTCKMKISKNISLFENANKSKIFLAIKLLI